MHKRQGGRFPGVSKSVLGLGLLLLAGCTSSQANQRASADPLLGGPPPRPPATAAAPAPTPATATGFVPPAPAPLSTTSPAALAATTSRPLGGGQELRIGNSAPAPTGGSWQGQGTPAGATLTRPDPPPQPLVHNDPLLARAAAPWGGGRAGSFEQAQSILSAHGVKWQRLETWGDQGEWKFSCSIPSRQNAFISRTYEGRATDSLAAVRAVLEQIDKEK